MKFQLNFAQAVVVLALCCTANCTLERQMEERSAASATAMGRMRATFVAKNKGVTGLLQRKKEATRGNEEKDYEDDHQSGHEIPQEKQTQRIVFRRSGKRRNKVKVPRSVHTAPKMRRRNYNAYLNRRRRQRVGRKRLRRFVPQRNSRLIRKKKFRQYQSLRRKRRRKSKSRKSIRLLKRKKKFRQYQSLRRKRRRKPGSRKRRRKSKSRKSIRLLKRKKKFRQYQSLRRKRRGKRKSRKSRVKGSSQKTVVSKGSRSYKNFMSKTRGRITKMDPKTVGESVAEKVVPHTLTIASHASHQAAKVLTNSGSSGKVTEVLSVGGKFKDHQVATKTVAGVGEVLWEGGKAWKNTDGNKKEKAKAAVSASAKHVDNAAFKVGANILGAAAGVKVAGMVGQTVIPVPVVGFVAGAAAGYVGGKVYDKFLDDKVNRVAKRHIELQIRSAKAAARVSKRGAKAAARLAKRGAQAAKRSARRVGRVAKRGAQAAKRGARRVGRGAKRGVRKVGRGIMKVIRFRI